MPVKLNKTGSMPGARQHVAKPAEGTVLPLRPAWISAELLAKTQEVWSREYGRPVGKAEAIEILVNVKHMAEALQKAKKEEAAK